jgi:WD40 repeat protein
LFYYILNINIPYLIKLNLKYDYLVATGSLDESIKIWDDTTGNMLANLKDNDTNCAPKVLLNINDCILASGTTCSTIDLWDLETGTVAVRLSGHTSPVTSLKLFKDNILASGSTDNTVKLWNLESYTLITTFNESVWVLSLEIIDEETLACGLNDGSISIYNIRTQTKIRTIKHGSDSVNSLLLLKDGSLASGDQFFSINIWNTINWTQMRSTKNIGAFRMTQYGEDILYFIGRAYYFHRLNLKTMEVTTISKETAYESMRLLCGGLLALGGNSPYELHIWNLTSETFIKAEQSHDKFIYAVEEVKMYPGRILTIF